MLIQSIEDVHVVQPISPPKTVMHSSAMTVYAAVELKGSQWRHPAPLQVLAGSGAFCASPGLDVNIAKIIVAVNGMRLHLVDGNDVDIG